MLSEYLNLTHSLLNISNHLFEMKIIVSQWLTFPIIGSLVLVIFFSLFGQKCFLLKAKSCVPKVSFLLNFLTKQQ